MSININNVKKLEPGQCFNIQGVKEGKKIKLKKEDWENLKREGEKIEVEMTHVEEPKKEIAIKEEKVVETAIKEEKKEEKVPSYLSMPDKEEYKIDEVALKEKIAGNYGNFVTKDKKEENKNTTPKKEEMTEIEFKKLLNTDGIEIMKDKIEITNELFMKLCEARDKAELDDSQYADEFQKVSNEEQVAKNDRDIKKKRLNEMKKPEYFTYLEIGKEEDERIIEAIRIEDEALKNLYNVNQIILKEDEAKIEQCEQTKKEINEASEKTRTEIHRIKGEIKKFIKEKAPMLQEIRTVNGTIKKVESESEKVLKNEYEALTREKEAKIVEAQPEPVVENPVAEQPVEIQEPEISPAMDNFKKVTAVHGMNDSLMGINDLYNEIQANQEVSERRVA